MVVGLQDVFMDDMTSCIIMSFQCNVTAHYTLD